MVYLIGAGPGHPGLITALGRDLLSRCDAVIYDRLGTNELLELVPEHAQKIYVGKKAGAHYRKQEEIQEILVETARHYETVIRLKGGDPFVFGRGGEEAQALQDAGLDYQIVPGVTSAVAVPELLGIPVTHRGVSRSFHVYTGHTKDEAGDVLEHIHPQEGTSVFLMGLGHLSQIVDKLIREGKDPGTPAAVISGGTLPSEQMVKAPLSGIAEAVAEAGLGSPAIILVGEAAQYDFRSGIQGPLAGQTIGVTATAALQEKMREQFEGAGARMFSLCDMKVETAPDQIRRLEQELGRIREYSWVAFTSQNSIRIFFETVRRLELDLRQFANVKFAVVGTGTERALRRQGFVVDYMPEEYTTQALAQGLIERVAPGQRLLLARARQGSEIMAKMLRDSEIQECILPIYDVVGRRTPNWEYLNSFDVITFASASGVEAFVEQIRETEQSVEAWEAERRGHGVKIATIGEVTRQALLRHGIRADIVPEQYDLDGLMQALTI